MVIIDANVILRIVLNDNEPMVNDAKALINSRQVLIKNEVLAEVIYVLTKVYKVNKLELCEIILKLIEVKNVSFESKDTVVCAVNTFENNSLDFVDCLIYAYHVIGGMEVFTFDKKLSALILKQHS